MLATAKIRRRTQAAARTAPKALRYRAISGDIAVLVDASRLVRVELLVEDARDKGNAFIYTDLLLDALGLEG
jgi:hypothetical protein